ncbi:DNA/RNA non-specific endonuclease [Jeotgalibacillus proteolyticus]|uniref:DNA/RNA non-specific endonuclease n=1 Tax=Jeotgalibacillus proteolyticus TaxID=2082395 RepID=UPI003CEB3B9B
MTQTVRYDAAALKETMEERVHQYVTYRESLDVLREKMRAVTDLGEAFEGKAAEAIKGFFTAQIDVVDMWLQLVEQQIAFMEDVGAMAEDRKLGGSTKMDVPFLEDDLNAAHKRTADMIQQQHEDLSAILSRIRDLVSLEAYSPAQIELSMQDAKNKRDDTVEQMEELDQVLVDEYGLSVESETLILALIEGLLQATTQNGTFSPMSFNVHAYENSEAHAAIEGSQQRSTEYIQHKQQLHEAREAQARQAELDARSGLQKFLDGTKNFVGEFSGYYDTVRASTGVDPVTGRELSASERTAAAAWAAAGIVPILGPASKVAKGGKAVFAVSKGSKAATAPLTAFKSNTQAFTRVSHAEKGIYGLVSANGLSGYFFGQDLLGNEVTAEQRTETLMMGSMLPFSAGMKMVKGNGADVLGVGVRGNGKDSKLTEIAGENFGTHIVKGKNGRKELTPNVRYVTKENYKYTTDELGRIADVKADKLILGKGKRNPAMQLVAGHEHRKLNDDGGHLIGTQFRGSGDIDNLLAQNKHINRSGGEWFKMETEWANALKEVPPKKVSVKIKPVFIGSSLRPDSFKVTYEIEGKGIFKKTIENRIGD